MRPNYFIFMGYLRKMILNQQSKPLPTPSPPPPHTHLYTYEPPFQKSWICPSMCNQGILRSVLKVIHYVSLCLHISLKKNSVIYTRLLKDMFREKKESARTTCKCNLTLFFVAFLFSKLTFSKNSLRNNIRVSNRLDPDQAQHFCGPDLGPSCLQRLLAGEIRKRKHSQTLKKQVSAQTTCNCF